jgi:uncharacterized protein
MSSRLPVEINPFRMVEQRKSLIGSLPFSRLPRLQELICSDKGGVNAILDFDRTDTHLPHVSGSIEVQFDLTCQRCLDNMTHTAKISLNLVLVKSEEQAERVPESFDTYLVEDDRLYLQEFIEDEILLALPLSTMHQQCEAARPYIEGLPEDEINVVEEDEQENPFATLKDLKGLE